MVGFAYTTITIIITHVTSVKHSLSQQCW